MPRPSVSATRKAWIVRGLPADSPSSGLVSRAALSPLKWIMLSPVNRKTARAILNIEGFRHPPSEHLMTLTEPLRRTMDSRSLYSFARFFEL
jgi:hypothetical protein